MRRTVLFLVVYCISLTYAKQPSIQGLGYMPGNTTGTQAYAVSANGSVVVGEGFVASTLRHEPFIWTAATGLQSLASADGAAYGISYDGLTVVGGSFEQAWRWTAADGMVMLGDLPGGRIANRASGVSADGTTIVGSSASHDFVGPLESELEFEYEACRWTGANNVQPLGYLNNSYRSSFANAISGNGLVVVGSSVIHASSGGAYGEAFRWTADEGMIGLGFLSGNQYSYAAATSFDGSVIVGTSGKKAFRWTVAGGMVELGGPTTALRPTEYLRTVQS